MFRSSFAVSCAASGVPLEVLSRWLGVSLAAVECYAAFAPQFNDLEVIERVWPVP